MKLLYLYPGLYFGRFIPIPRRSLTVRSSVEKGKEYEIHPVQTQAGIYRGCIVMTLHANKDTMQTKSNSM